MDESSHRWLLLLHQIPPKPAYFRAKVQRRLKALGAIAVKNSAYLLPANEDTLEDFQWLIREIHGEGGEAWLFEVTVIAGATNAALERQFNETVSAEYRALGSNAVAVLDRQRSEQTGDAAALEPGAVQADLQRLRKRWDTIRRRDHFQAEAAEEIRTLMNEIEESMVKGSQPEAGVGEASPTGIEGFNARTWVTRRDVKIDRIACAWLIQRFIDPAARFLFVNEPSDEVRPGEIRFDMFEGEFTHRGPSCTFEVLVADLVAPDRALSEIAEIVHDIDLKDDLFSRPEALGVAAVIDGLVLTEPEDGRRIEKGCEIFDGLYRRLSRDGEAAPRA